MNKKGFNGYLEQQSSARVLTYPNVRCGSALRVATLSTSLNPFFYKENGCLEQQSNRTSVARARLSFKMMLSFQRRLESSWNMLLCFSPRNDMGGEKIRQDSSSLRSFGMTEGRAFGMTGGRMFGAGWRSIYV